MNAENLKTMMELIFGTGEDCVKWRISDKQFHYDSETKEIFISNVFCDKIAVKQAKKLLVAGNKKLRFKNKYILYILYIVKMLECAIDCEWLTEIKEKGAIETDIVKMYRENLTVDSVNYFYAYSNEFSGFYRAWKEYFNEQK